MRTFVLTSLACIQKPGHGWRRTLWRGPASLERRRAGLTLIEVLLAVSILALAFVPLIDLLLGNFRINEASLNEIVCTNLANELVDSLVSADDWFIQYALGLCGAGWKDVATLPAGGDRAKFILSEIPVNVLEISYRLQRASGAPPSRPSYSLRVRVRWKEGPRDRTLKLGRFFVGKEQV